MIVLLIKNNSQTMSKSKLCILEQLKYYHITWLLIFLPNKQTLIYLHRPCCYCFEVQHITILISSWLSCYLVVKIVTANRHSSDDTSNITLHFIKIPADWQPNSLLPVDALLCIVCSTWTAIFALGSYITYLQTE